MTNEQSEKQKESDTWVCGWLWGLVTGFIVSCVVGANLVYNSDSDRATLEACEKKLPRNQYCTMIAVPSMYEIPKLEDQ